MDEEQLRKLREEMGETTIDQNPTQTVEPQATAQTGLTSEQIQQMREELGADGGTNDPYSQRPTEQTQRIRKTTAPQTNNPQIQQPITQAPNTLTPPQIPNRPTIPQSKTITPEDYKKLREYYSQSRTNSESKLEEILSGGLSGLLGKLLGGCGDNYSNNKFDKDYTINKYNI